MTGLRWRLLRVAGWQLLKARACLNNGDVRSARRWLDRAHRTDKVANVAELAEEWDRAYERTVSVAEWASIASRLSRMAAGYFG